MITAVTVTALCSFSFAFAPDHELEAYADELDRKYFPIFLETLNMINKREFQGLNAFFSKDLFTNRRPFVQALCIEKWNDYPEIFFNPSNFSQLKGAKQRITFSIDWGADPLKNTTWVFNFHNLLWLNHYLKKGENGDDASSLVAFKVINDWLISMDKIIAVRLTFTSLL